MPILLVTAGPYVGQQFPLAEGSTEIGRDTDCGISLAQDNGVSRNHARLQISNGRVTVYDLQSRNGVLVNGSRTPATILQPGDIVHLGNTDLTLSVDPPAAPVLTSPPLAIPPTATAPASSPYPAPVYPASPGGPPYGAPVYGSPAYGAPGPGAPAYGSPAYGSPAYGAPAYGLSGPAETKRQVGEAKWLYICAFTIPPLGILLGIIYMLKDTPEERRVGQWTLFWSILNGLLTWWGFIEAKKYFVQFVGQGGMGGAGSLLGNGDPTAGGTVDPSAILKHSVPTGWTNSLPGIPTGH